MIIFNCLCEPRNIYFVYQNKNKKLELNKNEKGLIFENKN